jgi:hypothetical protein
MLFFLMANTAIVARIPTQSIVYFRGASHGTISLWGGPRSQLRPFIFDPTLKNEGVGSSSAGVPVPAG